MRRKIKNPKGQLHHYHNATAKSVHYCFTSCTSGYCICISNKGLTRTFPLYVLTHAYSCHLKVSPIQNQQPEYKRNLIIMK